MTILRNAVTCLLLAVLSYPTTMKGADLVSRLEIPAAMTDLFPGAGGANLNRFGGFSDMYYHGPTDKWYALPDRGPGGGVLSYANRVEEFSLNINPTSGAISNFQITRTIPFLTSDGLQAYNGLNPQALNSSVGVLGRSFDPEGFAIGPSGNYFVSDEYGPSVYEFAPFNNAGQLEARFVRAFTLPDNVIPRDATSNLDYVAANPATGRQGNRGFEGLAINPSGTKLYVTLQSPLRHEGTPNGASTRNGRIYEFDIITGQRSAEYLYQFDYVDSINAGLSDPVGHAFPANQQGRFALSGITALSDTEFVVIERDSRGVGVLNPYTGFDATLDDVGIKKIYRINIAGASNVQGFIVADNNGTGGFVPVAKSLYFDIDAALAAAGQITPEKFEGIAFGPDLANGSKLLLLGIDNDFSATQLVGSNTQYDIYTNGSAVRISPIDDPSHSFAGFDPLGADLGQIPAGYNLLPIYAYSVTVPVPEPSTWVLLFFGAVALAIAKQRARISGIAAALTLALGASSARAQYSVTVLHHNDAESKIFNLGTGAAADYGGIARFKTLFDTTRTFYQGMNHGVVTISAGDSYLAGANFQASLDSGTPGSRTFYDALGMSLIGYDAVTIGNHEFDFGPGVLAEFIGDAQTTNPTKFLSSNLDFAGEPSLQAHLTAGRIAPSTIVNVATAAGTKKIGIIGATTETLPFVSSPGNVVVGNVAAAVNSQIASLQGAGADLIILSSHLQGLTNEQALVPMLNPGIDLIIAGGGDELLANVANPSPLTVHGPTAPGSVTNTGLVPVSGYNSTTAPNQPLYPVESTLQDLGGNKIPIVTGRDNYSYLNRITLNVDAVGNVTVDPSSNPQRVASLTADPTHGVAPNANMQTTVVDPVNAFISGLAATNIGQTSVLLNRSDVRFRETNLGNLVADGFLTQSKSLAPQFNTDVPKVALVNGGGIRDFIGAGTITRLDTFDVSPFGNLLAVVKDVTSADFKMLLENAVSKVTDSPAPGITPTGTDGRFTQVSGFSFTYDISATPLNLSPTGAILTLGARIIDVRLDDGTPIVANGVPVPGATLDVATLNFLAAGGDQYFDPDYLSMDYFTNTTLLGGTSDQQALQAYIESFLNANLGADLRYDEIVDGRINAVPEPASVVLLALSGFGLLVARMRRGVA